MELNKMIPTPLRALDLSRKGKHILLRIVTDTGNVDLSIPRAHALTMGTALAEYASGL
jgi:hypothetical protein